ncbi:DUF4148 domain-containing protein [Caballeronia sp. 15711]|uniref:DUF4148 domain-containing protein n=1 Tax=Caballeronia sp. 15711 TaxID=3391029 RepID=UPI0039E4EBEE
MKRVISSTILMGIFAAPIMAKAQTTGLTREQVRAELVQLQQSGYRLDSEASYPRNLQAAESNLANGRLANNGSAEGYGGEQPSTVNSGRRAKFEPQPIYFGGS